MSLEREIRKNKELRKNVESIVETKCKELGIKQVNEYHMFLNGKNIGQTVRVPTCCVSEICDLLSQEIKYSVSVSHRNMYLQSITE